MKFELDGKLYESTDQIHRIEAQERRKTLRYAFWCLVVIVVTYAICSLAIGRPVPLW